MKIKTSELVGTALDWAVAKCEGVDSNFLIAHDHCGEHFYQYSTNWLSGGSIIEREKMALEYNYALEQWFAIFKEHPSDIGRYVYGLTPLIAAMRCYITSRLGDEVEIPNELISSPK